MGNESLKFKFLPDVAIADLAFRAEGRTREELFANCGLALMSAMANAAKIKAKVHRVIEVDGKGDKELLYNFLEELVYLKDTEGVLFRKFKVRISQGKNKKDGAREMSLSAECAGDSLKAIGRENLLNDVKAITMHMFEVRREKGKWGATVVVDI
ncbi:Protein archease [uncultured archaeon]|nr:Protein archease [uncultured archaeon]